MSNWLVITTSRWWVAGTSLENYIIKLPRKHTLNGGKSRARKHTFCSCFFCVCFFFAHNIRIIPVQASRQKSDGKVFPTFFHFSEDLKNWDFNPGGTTITIKQNTNANYYSGRQFEIFDKKLCLENHLQT